MREQRIAEIRARCEAASLGPWEWADDALWAVAPTDDFDDSRIIETDSGYYPPRDNDRAFIAHARDDIPWLLAEIERLTISQSPDSRRGNG